MDIKKYWLNIDDCARLAGVDADMLKDIRLRPLGGLPEGTQFGRSVWNRKTIDEWLLITDEGREAYIDACNESRYK